MGMNIAPELESQVLTLMRQLRLQRQIDLSRLLGKIQSYQYRLSNFYRSSCYVVELIVALNDLV